MLGEIHCLSKNEKCSPVGLSVCPTGLRKMYQGPFPLIHLHSVLQEKSKSALYCICTKAGCEIIKVFFRTFELGYFNKLVTVEALQFD